MKTWTYSWIVYPLLYSMAVVVGFFSQKVRETLRLRSWKDYLSLRFNVGASIDYWVHVASHGEMEYAVPILEELAKRNIRVLVTYYSISAKEPVEKLPSQFPNVSLVVPLPHDGLGLMADFVRLAANQGVQKLLLLKYELWPGLLWECNSRKIRVYLVDALKPSWFHQKLLHKLDGILSGYPSEIERVDHRNIRVVGDTRVERVQSRLKSSQHVEKLFGGLKKLSLNPILVCGSMWPPDSECLIKALSLIEEQQRPHLVWVPHELDSAHADLVLEQLKGLNYFVTETIDDTAHLSSKPVAIIVKKKGILTELYRFGDIAFVGGGFGKGVHSVWEPAIAGCQVACGPNTKRSPESTQLEAVSLLSRVHSNEQLRQWILEQSGFRNLPQNEKLLGVLKTHEGAANRIVNMIEGV